jgi:hypothetical protein
MQNGSQVGYEGVGCSFFCFDILYPALAGFFYPIEI